MPLSFCILVVVIIVSSLGLSAQEMKFALRDDTSSYVKVQFFTQFWARYNESNPGTMQQGEVADETFDIGIRRARVQAFAQISERASLFLHYGFNNYNTNFAIGQNRRLQAFFHDVFGEYRLTNDNAAKIGIGLSFVNGLSRFSQPAVLAMPTADIPVFGQATVEQIDVFGRKLGITLRGQIGPIDYRLALNDPFPITSSGQPQPLGPFSNFAQVGHSLQQQAYVLWQFFDHEPHVISNMAGAYLGKRKIFNVGSGFMRQPRAMWRSAGADTIHEDMLLFAVESMMDMPITDGGTTLTMYGAHFWNDYGQGYLRFNGVMNPGTALTTSRDSSALAPLTRFGPSYGNAFPMFGTGRVLYGHAAVYFPKVVDVVGLMPYVSFMHANYERLAKPMNVFHLGCSLLLDGFRTRITVDIQNRPTFGIDPLGGTLEYGPRKNQFVLQYQLVM
ncbi:MAG: hypothetical protein MUC47_09760 [Candidatus Kapabacteria bacterium]|nr:hypothetical protein [Candidatus Kapabacteria bacterium]